MAMVTPSELMVLSDEDNEAVANLVEFIDGQIREMHAESGQKKFEFSHEDLAAEIEATVLGRSIQNAVVEKVEEAGWRIRNKDSKLTIFVPYKRKSKVKAKS